MANKVIPKRVWEELQDSGYGVRGDYSGRGMFGEKCAGFVCNYGSLVSLGVELHQLMGDDAIDVAAKATTDSMGRDTIVYFPGVQLEDWKDEEPEEEEEEVEDEE